MAWARVVGATRGLSSAMSAAISTFDMGSLGAAVAANDRVIAVIMFADQGNLTVTSVTDSLSNTYSKDASVGWIDGVYETELSVWSAVSAAGTPSNITAHFSGSTASNPGLACAIGAYSGLSTTVGSGAIDVSKIIAGSGAGTDVADSGTTVATTTAGNELKIGAFGDDGWNRTITAGSLDTAYSTFIEAEAATTCEASLNDADSGASGSTARATETISGTGTPLWGMAVVVYKLSGIPLVTLPFYESGQDLRPRIKQRPRSAVNSYLNLMGLFPKASAGSPDVTRALTGIGATASVGTLGVLHDQALTGVGATGSVGTVSVSHTQALTGILATGSAGTVVPSTTKTLAGVLATGSTGTVTPNTTVTLTGVQATGAVGAVTTSTTTTLAGVLATGSAGTVAPSTTVSLTGVLMNGAVGTITASVGGDVTVALAGVSAVGSVGTLAPSTTVAITGVGATGAAGSVSPNTSVALSGVAATGSVGTITASTSGQAVTVALTGVLATAYAGVITASGADVPPAPMFVPETIAVTPTFTASTTGGTPAFGQEAQGTSTDFEPEGQPSGTGFKPEAPPSGGGFSRES